MAMTASVFMAMRVVVLPVASISLVIHRGRIDDPRLRLVIDGLGRVIDTMRWVIPLRGVIASTSPIVTGDGDAGSDTQRTADSTNG